MAFYDSTDVRWPWRQRRAHRPPLGHRGCSRRRDPQRHELHHDFVAAPGRRGGWRTVDQRGDSDHLSLPTSSRSSETDAKIPRRRPFRRAAGRPAVCSPHFSIRAPRSGRSQSRASAGSSSRRAPTQTAGAAQPPTRPTHPFRRAVRHSALPRLLRFAGLRIGPLGRLRHTELAARRRAVV